MLDHSSDAGIIDAQISITGRWERRFGKLFSLWALSFFSVFLGVDFTEEALSLKLSPAVRFSLVISTISDAEMTGPLKTAAEQVVAYAVSKISYALCTISHWFRDRYVWMEALYTCKCKYRWLQFKGSIFKYRIVPNNIILAQEMWSLEACRVVVGSGLVAKSCRALQPHGLYPARLLCPGKNTEVGCHALLQGIFLTQGSNLGLLHCRWILHWLNHQGSRSMPWKRIKILLSSSFPL